MEKSNNPDGQISKNYDNQLEASVDQRETSPQGRYIKVDRFDLRKYTNIISRMNFYHYYFL